MEITAEHVAAGQAVYNNRTLAIYDVAVLGLSNRFIWKCPTQRLIDHYDRHVTDNHLDVGVGTGYFLDRCQFPSEVPRVALMDLNTESLAYAAKRIKRYQPQIFHRNVLDPIILDVQKFDSIGINYLLHCIPGTIESKAAALDHLKEQMNPGATLFGATLLQGGVPRNWLAKRLMAIYNRKGIFSNAHDTLDGLQRQLEYRFTDVTLEVAGCVALFSGRTW